MAKNQEDRSKNFSSRESWNKRYAQGEQVWSGEPNSTLVQIVSDLSDFKTVESLAAAEQTVTVLDLGCGEGADVIWLAEQGWQVTGIDISDLAIDRARAAARSAGVAVDFVCADLAGWKTDQRFDLIVSSFLQSQEGDLDRITIFNSALKLLKPGGRFISISHAGAPSFASSDGPRHDHIHLFPDPVEEAQKITAGNPGCFEVLAAQRRTRQITSPQGQLGTIDDGILMIRRLD